MATPVVTGIGGPEIAPFVKVGGPTEEPFTVISYAPRGRESRPFSSMMGFIAGLAEAP